MRTSINDTFMDRGEAYNMDRSEGICTWFKNIKINANNNGSLHGNLINITYIATCKYKWNLNGGISQEAR